MSIQPKSAARAQSFKTPNTLDTSSFKMEANTEGEVKDMAFTPTQFKSNAADSNMNTDEQGNRSSIRPSSARPSSIGRQSSSGIKISDPSEAFPA